MVDEYYFALTTESDSQTMQPINLGSINDGMFKKNPKGEYPTITVSVESIDEHIKKIESDGGKQIMPKMNIGEHGFYARISDTEGNVIGLWESLKQ